MGLETALFAMSAAQAVSGYLDQNKARKAANRANEATSLAAEKEAAIVRQDSAYAADQERKEAARVRGQQITAFLKSGVTLDGSPLLVQSETTDQGNRNAQNTIETGDRKAQSIINRGEANQQNVAKGDLFGTAVSVLGAGRTAYPQTFKNVRFN